MRAYREGERGASSEGWGRVSAYAYREGEDGEDDVAGDIAAEVGPDHDVERGDEEGEHRYSNQLHTARTKET
jgi:hypothetical protein